MKKGMFILFAFALTLVACNKEDQVSVEDAITTSEDLATVQNIVQDTEDEIDAIVETTELETTPDLTTNECPVVTVTPEDGSFPRTVTIDYGTEGCEGPRGRLRKGQIIITQTDLLRVAGAVRTVTFSDFSIDEVALEGTKTITNNGLNDAGQPSLSREVSGAQITYPDGLQVSWEALHTLTQIGGVGTLPLIDNVFTIEGGSSGVNRNGVAFSATITTPLTKSKNCEWIESGVKEYTFGDRTRTLDYGAGSCENLATATFANGTTRTVRIRAWWRR
ncbi:MAG: hypothetical protein AAF798_10060 [Bacteroidota bacterium]